MPKFGRCSFAPGRIIHDLQSSTNEHAERLASFLDPRLWTVRAYVRDPTIRELFTLLESKNGVIPEFSGKLIQGFTCCTIAAVDFTGLDCAIF